MRKKTGALQPWPVRQVAVPWPYWPPTTNAAFFRLGTTAMQVADSVIWFGMPLSGVAMISLMTRVAASRRLSRSVLLDAAEAGRPVLMNPSPTRARPARNFFIVFDLLQTISVFSAFPRFVTPAAAKWRPTQGFAHL